MKAKLIACLSSAIDGVILLFAAKAYNDTHDFLENSFITNGHVVALFPSGSKDSYGPQIAFQDHQQSIVVFTSTVGRKRSVYAIGDQVKVVFSRANSEAAKVKSFFSLWGTTLAVGVFGMALFIPGLVLMLLGLSKIRKRRHLQQYGMVVEADLKSVEVKHSLSLNGRHPYVIVCTWLNPITHVLHRLESDNLWNASSSYIDRAKFNKQNPQRVLPRSFIPAQAGRSITPVQQLA